MPKPEAAQNGTCTRCRSQYRETTRAQMENLCGKAGKQFIQWSPANADRGQ
jgi:hypothetical protein